MIADFRQGQQIGKWLEERTRGWSEELMTIAQMEGWTMEKQTIANN